MKIQPYEFNAKKHDQKQIKLIAESIKRFGCKQPIVVDNQGIIIAGHGRYLAMTTILEWDQFKKAIYSKKGETFIPYILADDLTEKEIKAYRLADNKLNESKWVMSLVKDELRLINDDELMRISGFSGDILLDAKKRDDDIPENSPTRAKFGDLWALGRHLILCGDSTNPDDFNRLMGEDTAQMCFTDPPYNIDYQGGMNSSGKNKRSGIKNDKMDKASFREFLDRICQNIIEKTQGGIYICMSSSEIDSLKQAFICGGALAELYYLGKR